MDRGKAGPANRWTRRSTGESGDSAKPAHHDEAVKGVIEPVGAEGRANSTWRPAEITCLDALACSFRKLEDSSNAFKTSVRDFGQMC